MWNRRRTFANNIDYRPSVLLIFCTRHETAAMTVYMLAGVTKGGLDMAAEEERM